MAELDGQLSADENQKIYNSIIKPYLFQIKNKNLTSQEQPRVYIIGGQPAAGKTSLIKATLKELGKNAVMVNGDDFRQYHPAERELYNRFGAESSKYTHPDCAKWAIQALYEAGKNHNNILLESTLRNPQDTINTIALLQKNGYEAHLRVVVVDDLTSQSGNYARYHHQLADYEKNPTTASIPRFTPPAHHDEAYNNMLHTLKEVQKTNTTIMLYDRLGTELYNSHHADNLSAAEKAQEVRNTAWSLDKYQNFVMNNENLVTLMQQNHADQKDIEAINTLSDRAQDKLVALDKHIANRIQQVRACTISSPKQANPTQRYDAYCKQAMSKTDGIFKYKNVNNERDYATDKEVYKAMAKDGHERSHIAAALIHSPSFGGEKNARAEAMKLAVKFEQMPELKKIRSNFLER